MNKKVIALVDCDSFFVACEQVCKPELRGKAVCVLSNNDGCVVSRSREAKQMGVQMGMPYFQAHRQFRDCVYLSGNHELYKYISTQVMDVLKNYSPVVEVCSIDEAYVDFTGLCRLYRMNYYKMAQVLRKKIWDEVQITVSVGLGTSKTLAKLASDKAKNTGGVYLIGQSKLKKLLPITNINEVCGIGKRMKIALNKEGILNCAEFVKKDDLWLDKKFGIIMKELKHELLGENISPIKTVKEPPKSIQETCSFPKFTSDKEFLKNEIKHHIKDACRKLRKHEGKTSTVALMLKTRDFRYAYEKKILINPICTEQEILKAALELFEKIYSKSEIYRATGIMLYNIKCGAETQLTLFEDECCNKYEKLAQSIDRLEERFGKNIIKTGFM